MADQRILDKPYQAPEIESFISDIFDSPHADDLAELRMITGHEAAEILSDQMQLIHQDVRTNKGKIFSQGQVQRLMNQERLLRLAEYRQVTYTKGTRGFDSSPFLRFLFYTNRFHKRKGFFADNMLKCTVVRTPGHAGYVVVFDSDWGLIHFAFTGHFFDRLALRKQLDASRTESIYDVIQEFSRGFLIKDLGLDQSGEVLVYSNEGISLGQGISLVPGDGTGNSFRKDFSAQTDNRKVFRFILLKTFITNEMASSSQISHAESAQRVWVKSDRIKDYVDRSYVDGFFRVHHEKLRK